MTHAVVVTTAVDRHFVPVKSQGGWILSRSVGRDVGYDTGIMWIVMRRAKRAALEPLFPWFSKEEKLHFGSRTRG